MHGDLLSIIQQTRRLQLKLALSAADLLSRRMAPQALQGRCMVLCCPHPADPEATVKNSLISCRSTPQDVWHLRALTRADAWRFAVHNPADPETAV